MKIDLVNQYDLSLKAGQKLLDLLKGQVELKDRKGHHFPARSDDLGWQSFVCVDTDRIREFLDGKLTEPLPIRQMRCHNCGEAAFGVTNNGVVAIRKCSFFDAHLKPYSVEIDVPSGKICFANDIRHYFIEDRHLGFDICTMGGTIKYTEAYAKKGLIQHYVGNTCPEIHQTRGTLYVGHSGNEFVWNGKKNIKRSKAAVLREKLPGKKVGGVCTDLWWYGMCDRDLLQRKVVAAEDLQPSNFDKWCTEHDVGTIEVKPGRYRAEHYYHLRCWEEDKGKMKYPRIFSKITQVGL